ncbi:MAG: DUF6340 family protein [Bacteroidota bacterium]
MKKYFIFFILLLSMNSCTNSIRLQVLQPAQITMPEHIKKFVVANRSRASKNNQAMNIIEGVLTGEEPWADREGAGDCLYGFIDMMTKTPHFTVTQAAGVDLYGTGTSIFPIPLRWDEVEKICKDNNADAMVVLEAFDSDSRIDLSSRQVQTKGQEGQPITVIEHYANAKMEITTGWRVYEPKTKSIIDEYKFSDFLDFNSKGTSPEDAKAKLPSKRDCINKTGFHVGKKYGYRIAPQWILVIRNYYNKGNDNMKLAARKIRQVNDWKNAMELWKKEALNNNVKIAGRASYNMAVVCEREGNLEIALEWVKKSYLSGNKNARNYMNILNARIQDAKRLNEQMK